MSYREYYSVGLITQKQMDDNSPYVHRVVVSTIPWVIPIFTFDNLFYLINKLPKSFNFGAPNHDNFSTISYYAGVWHYNIFINKTQFKVEHTLMEIE